MRRWVAGVFTILLFLALVPTPLVRAQEETTCATLVQDALALTGSSCGAVGRNQACYGNPLLDATFHAADLNLRFSVPADQVPVQALDTLRTFPLDPETGVWGVGVMRIQANLPDVRPGEVVTFLLFGDVTLQNAGAAEQPTIPEPCAATVPPDVEGHIGPGYGFASADVADRAVTVQITARSQEGSWLLAETSAGAAWYPASAAKSACDFSAFPIHDAAGPVNYGPMQAFYFTSGIGSPLCHELPPSSLVVQSPHGTRVAFSVNGVSVTIGSTVALQATPGEALVLTTLEGEAVVHAAGASQRVPAGFFTAVPLGGARGLEPQGAPTPIDVADMAAFGALSQTPDVLLTYPIVLPDAAEVTARAEAMCGDAVCQAFESAAACALDCSETACNGVCDGTDCLTCPSDCRADQCYWCGNGICDPTEDAVSCPAECDVSANGDNVGDVRALCGDGICQGHESADTCPQDCADGKLCGDEICQGHESADTCPQDCGPDGPLCGDGVCQGHESASTCPQDCGGDDNAQAPNPASDKEKKDR